VCVCVCVMVLCGVMYVSCVLCVAYRSVVLDPFELAWRSALISLTPLLLLLGSARAAAKVELSITFITPSPKREDEPLRKTN
jgi:hypothetical protein